MRGLWPMCDPVTSSWPCTDSIVTSCWPLCDPALNCLYRLNPSCEQCGHAHSTMQSNKEVYLSWPVGGAFAEQRDRICFDPHPLCILPTCSGPGFPRTLTSTPSLRARSFPGPLIFDILMSHMTTPSPWGQWWSHPGVTYTTQMPTVSTCTHLCVCQMNRWENEVWTFPDLLPLMPLSFAALKPEKGLLIYMDFRFPSTKGNGSKTSTNSTRALSTHIQMYLHACSLL